MRKIFTSKDTGCVASQNATGKVEVYSFFPNDKASCECQPIVLEFKKKLAMLNEGDRKKLLSETKRLICPRDKKGMFRYKITCKNCGEVLGYCWATDNTLKDWCDFHYVCWADETEWHGCLTPHISPITEQLCLECTCGSDTRDFRANMTLPYKTTSAIELINRIGRDFGKASSYFSVSKTTANVLPFNLK